MCAQQPEWRWSLPAIESMATNTPDKHGIIIGCAHEQLCELFNNYPPLLVPFGGREPAEMPRIAEEGIREVLYFQLRIDYLAQRQLGTCRNCGGHFPIMRRGARACSETCRKALRNQKYWQANKEEINRQRRKQDER